MSEREGEQNHEESVISVVPEQDECYHTTEVVPYVKYDEIGHTIISDDPSLVELLMITTNGDPQKIKSLINTSGATPRKAVLSDKSCWIRLTLLAKAFACATSKDSTPEVAMRATKVCLDIINGAQSEADDFRQTQRATKATGRLAREHRFEAVEREFLALADDGSEIEEEER